MTWPFGSDPNTGDPYKLGFLTSLKDISFPSKYGLVWVVGVGGNTLVTIPGTQPPGFPLTGYNPGTSKGIGSTTGSFYGLPVQTYNFFNDPFSIGALAFRMPRGPIDVNVNFGGGPLGVEFLFACVALIDHLSFQSISMSASSPLSAVLNSSLRFSCGGKRGGQILYSTSGVSETAIDNDGTKFVIPNVNGSAPGGPATSILAFAGLLPFRTPTNTFTLTPATQTAKASVTLVSS